jgi:hypothetical protein
MPVTKRISRCDSLRACAMAETIASVVTHRFSASARAALISATPWREYSMQAASTMVGTGR